MKKSKKPIIIFILLVLCAAAVTAGMICGTKEAEKHQAFYDGFTKYAYKDDNSHYLYFDKDSIRSDGKYRRELVVKTDHSMDFYYSRTRFHLDGSAEVVVSTDSKGREKPYSFRVSEENNEYYIHDLSVKDKDTEEYIPKLSKNFGMSKDEADAEMQVIIDARNKAYEEKKAAEERAARRSNSTIYSSDSDSSSTDSYSSKSSNSSDNTYSDSGYNRLGSSDAGNSYRSDSNSYTGSDNDYYDVHSYSDADYSFAEDHYEDFMEDEDFDDEEEAYDEAADYWDANN